MEVIEIKQKIKEWEYSFREKHNKPPSKSDIKENSEIHKLYSLYRAIKQENNPNKHPRVILLLNPQLRRMF